MFFGQDEQISPGHVFLFLKNFAIETCNPDAVRLNSHQHGNRMEPVVRDFAHAEGPPGNDGSAGGAGFPGRTFL